MKKTIYNHQNKTAIFISDTKNDRELVEKAVKNKIDLTFADLRYMDLRHANLDGGKFDHADFSFSQCEGINISEAQLAHAVFRNCNLVNACFCDSDLSHTRFMNSNLSLADISGAHLEQTQFSDLSALQLNFIDAAEIKACVYKNVSGQKSYFSNAPLTIKGLPEPVSILDHAVLYGDKILPPHSLSHHQSFPDLRILFSQFENTALKKFEKHRAA